MIELQNFLMLCDLNDSYRGVTITQEYFFFKNRHAGFLKVQINMTQCSMPRHELIRLFDYGMIDHIIFNTPEEACLFGKKFAMIIGNITISESVQAQIYSYPPKSYGLREEPARHKVFLVPLSAATYLRNPPTDIEFMDHLDFYIFLEQERKRVFNPTWPNYNLLCQGRTLIIYGPSNWKIRVPFEGDEACIKHEDFMERPHQQRDPMVYNIDNRHRRLMADELLEDNSEDKDEEDIWRRLQEEENKDAARLDESDHFDDSQNEDTD